MKLPRLAILFFGLLPPALRADDVNSTVAVNVTVAQTVGESLRGGHHLALGARSADRDALPGLRRILARREVTHFSHGIRTRRIPGHDQDFLAGLEQIDVDRRFVAGARREEVLLPFASLGTGIGIPVTGRSGERDHDDIRVAVAVEIIGEAAKRLAVLIGLVDIELAVGTQNVTLPFACGILGRLIPAITGNDVAFAILVDIHNTDAFRAILRVDDDILPGKFE